MQYMNIFQWSILCIKFFKEHFWCAPINVQILYHGAHISLAIWKRYGHVRRQCVWVKHSLMCSCFGLDTLLLILLLLLCSPMIPFMGFLHLQGCTLRMRRETWAPLGREHPQRYCTQHTQMYTGKDKRQHRATRVHIFLPVTTHMNMQNKYSSMSFSWSHDWYRRDDVKNVNITDDTLAGGAAIVAPQKKKKDPKCRFLLSFSCLKSLLMARIVYGTYNFVVYLG